MEHPLKRQDFLTLHYIVEEAHKKYLKESRISKQPAFNILRVLSAFKDVFPTTPDRLYKLIMLITKKHNPQTLDQWTRAIDKINSPELIKNSRSQLNLNESSFRDSQESRILKQKQHQNSIKTYKEELDYEIECVESKRSRMKFIGDFRVTEPSWMAEQAFDENKENNISYSNKNSLRNSQHAHLISFEPTHKDSIKQNAQKLRSMIKEPHNLSQTQKYELPKKLQLPKKINPYHEITKIDNLSYIEDREPTSKDESKTMYSHNTRTESNSRMYFHKGTPRDNSFIRVMALDSKDSDLSMGKSELITGGKSGEILECQDYNMSLEQWEELNDRAIIFSEFNTKLKAFSALLANYQAFESDRYLKNKADIFHSCYLETKAFIGLKSNVHYEQISKEKYNKADEFHVTKLTQKVWKVLQVLRDLRIQGPKKPFKVQKLNRINYQFLLTFMFEEKTLNQTSPQRILGDKNDQILDFDRKVQYFSKTHQNFDNVWNIYKYFGLNITMSKDQLTEFFKNYHQCMQRTIFTLLKQNVENRKYKYLEMHEKRLTEKTFSILLGRKQVAKEYKLNQIRAQKYANKKLKQKAYKILLSIVYSTKIFSKRQEFIEAQRLQRIKMKVLKKWVSELKAIQLKKKKSSQKLDIFVTSITKFLQKVAFRSIQKDSNETEEKIVMSAKYWEQRIQRRVLRNFLGLVENKRKYISLCETNEIEFQKKILNKWLKISKVSYGLKHIESSLNKIVFRKLFVPLAKCVVKEYLMNQEDQQNLVKECFDALKVNFEESEGHRNECLRATEQFLRQNFMNEFMKSLQLNRIESIKQRETLELNQKCQKLIKMLEESSRSKVYIKLREKNEDVAKNNQRKSQLRCLILSESLSLFTKNTVQDLNLESNSSKLDGYLKFKCFESLRNELKRSQIQKRTIELKIITEKSTFSKFTKIISQRCLSMKKMQEKALIHYKNAAQKKGMLSLAKNLIEITQKSHILETMLQKQKKKNYWGKFVEKTRKQVSVREKSERVQKMQPFSGLRENLRLKKRENGLKRFLKESKICLGLEGLITNKQTRNEAKLIALKQERLKYILFWIQFNSSFIQSLMYKKHTFMAYKFRALKLYEMGFSWWKEVIVQRKKFNMNVNRNQDQLMGKKEHKREQSLNIKTKELTHMYKPTDCE